MQDSPGKAIVIGAGVIGTASAYYLAASGWQVTIVDQDRFGRACSHGNCGFVCPSHVMPLPGPGAIRDSLSLLLRSNSPLRIRPGMNLGLWRWLLRFAGHCNRASQTRAAAAKHQILQASLSLYRDLLKAEPIDCQWQEKGLLFVYKSEREWEHYRPLERRLRDQFGICGQPIDAAQLVKLEPALQPGLGGAWHYQGDSHLRADQLMNDWRDVLESRGVRILEHTCAGSWRTDGGRVQAIETEAGDLAADLFVLAAGAWSPLLQKKLGCHLPIQPGKGYSLTMSRPAVCPDIPMLFEEDRVGVTPFSDGFRLGSTMELVGYDRRIPPARLDYLQKTAAAYLRPPCLDVEQEQWYGWRPLSCDDVPIIDRSPALSNVLIAAGHGMLGLSMATGTGLLIANLANNEQPHIDPKPYAVARFGR